MVGTGIVAYELAAFSGLDTTSTELQVMEIIFKLRYDKSFTTCRKNQGLSP